MWLGARVVRDRFGITVRALHDWSHPATGLLSLLLLELDDPPDSRSSDRRRAWILVGVAAFNRRGGPETSL
jgi:hypothetical protein